MTNRSNRKIFKFLMIAFSVSLLCTFMAMAAPQAKIQASIEQPKLRGAYKNDNNIKLEGDVSLARGNQIISVSLRDSDVKQALRMFADKAGLNIIFHSSVNGKITLDLVDVTLNNAFKMIMQMSELSYVIDNDTIMVMSAESSKKIDISKENMSIIPIKYVDASSVADFLNKNIFSINKPGLSNNEIVVTNPIRNELLVFGTDNDYRMAKKIVEKLDTKPKATTYKVNHTTPKEMATLLCETLFAAPSASGGGGTSSGASSGGTTGGAADEGGGASSDNASSGGGGANGTITLGGGVVACKISNPIRTDKLTSLNNTTLSIVYHPALGAISVFGGSIEQINMINEFITANDRKQPQAYIEFSIVELTEEGSKEFNNNWQIWSKNFSGSFGTAGLVTNPLYSTFWKGNGFTNVNPDGTTASQVLKYGGPLTVSQNISYLIKNGKGRVLANPKVMVTNGKTSVIDLTSDYVESTTSQVIQGNGITNAVQKTYNIAKDNGMKISVTPFISPDGYVSMNLIPDYATIKEQIKDLGADGRTQVIAATLLQRRNLNLSNVRIKDGETLAIAGMIKESETQSVTKLPILGDIPIIGTFFRNQSKTTTKEELVIMITPRIVKDTEDVARI